MINKIAFFIFIVILFTCSCSISRNDSLLQDTIAHYRASGGAYIVMDMQTNKIITEKVIDFDLNKPYQPDFSVLGINESLQPKQILQQYIMNVSDNPRLHKLLRENVLFGEAKNVNIPNINIYGLTATTNKGTTKEVITTFLGHFIAPGHTYGIIVILDNPQPLRETYSFRSAGWNVINLARELIITLTTELR